MIPVIGKQDLANIKNKELSLKSLNQSGVSSFLNNEVRLRSGSPGCRGNVDKVMKESMNSPNPKKYLKDNFKNDMKKFGLQKDMKNLKSFKFCLASRSQEAIPQDAPGRKSGDQDGDV